MLQQRRILVITIWQTHTCVHAGVSAPWYDHARLDLPAWARKIGRGTFPCRGLVAALRQPVDTLPCPVRCIFIREPGLSAPIPIPDLKFPGRISLCAVQRTPAGIRASRGGPFSRTPEAETHVVSPQPAPVPPPPASSCGVSRGWHGRHCATERRDLEEEVGLFS